ncbi:ABC transporter substrate-binding protein [Eubacterium limosum]|uniref:Extracellular solute-binding protein n=1 Tax=Eubacterium limosum TaxID=1736 RepID=A0ABT5USG0_EUBLI|nr:extracellular solute-binding protein [Eubacterium limosum]MDE1471309.1 extracellular solute-binding protein [Eubacterium limosum]
MKRKDQMIGSAFLCALLCLLMAVSGCQSMEDQNYTVPAAEKSETVNLKFFGNKNEALNVVAIEEILKAYMEEYPDVNITYESVKGADYFDVLMKRIRSGNGDDIFMINHDTMLELMKTGELADLSGLPTIEDFSPGARSQMTFDGVVPFVPTSISAFGLYCNLGLLAENNLEVPETYAEFLAACEVFSEKDITPIVANNDISLKTLAISRGMFEVYKGGGAEKALEQMNADPSLLAEAMRPGFEMVHLFIDRGYVDAGRTLKTEKTKDDLADFATGSYPFMLTGAWASPRVAALNPGLNYKVYPYPAQEDGSVLVTNVDTRVAVNARSAHVEEAKKFLEYLTQKDVMWEFVDSQSSFSPLEDNRLSSDPAVQPLNAYMTNGRSILGTDSNLKYPIWDLSKESVRGLLKGQSVEEVLGDFEAGLKKSQPGGAQ